MTQPTFTKEDVEMLRDVACCPEHIRLCADLARRIEEALKEDK